MEYYAHTCKNSNDRQTLRAHLRETAILAGGFAPYPLKRLAYEAGLLHDIGKYRAEFQERIRGKDIAVEHAGSGAVWVKENFCGEYDKYALAYCIAGHHGGLPDGGVVTDGEDESTLLGRLKRNPGDCSGFAGEFKNDLMSLLCPMSGRSDSYLSLFDADFKSCSAEKQKQLFFDVYAFMVRVVFSCLTDADFLNTEQFCNYDTVPRGRTTDFEKCTERLAEVLGAFQADTPVKKSRAALHTQAMEAAEKDADIYYMNMPTGSGKTLTSIDFALRRLQKTGKKRIIYVIPYTAIIEQTAKEFERIFGKEIILQHHSNYDFDKPGQNGEEDCDTDDILRRAAENWDAPIILTTNVQFFESIYGNRSGKLRRLHNMADSVIVFDEVHKMPINYLAPCLKAVGCITRTLNSEAVFLTATMPDFDTLFRKYSPINLRSVNLIGDTAEFDSFKNCSYRYIGQAEDETVATLAQIVQNALIIVNTRARARKIYNLLGGEKYHLSTYMTPYDREKVIDRIKTGLAAGRRLHVVSTSLIEAGVDIDFDCVLRELAGLDSILQAGGRCNREGKKKDAEVIIWEAPERPKGDLGLCQNITRGLIKTYSGSLASPACIRAYFDAVYTLSAGAAVLNDTEKYIHAEASAKFISVSFRQYAEDFRFIDSATVSVAVRRDDTSKQLTEALRANRDIKLKRRLQRYCASVYQSELNELIEQGAVDDFDTGLYVLTVDGYYSPETGLFFNSCEK